MAMTILDSTTAVAVEAATTQYDQIQALIADWAGGNVTVKVMSGSTLLSTLTFEPWAHDRTPEPDELALGANLTRTNSAEGTPSKLVFCNGATEIFQCSAGIASEDAQAAASIKDLCYEDLAAIVFTAVAELSPGGPAQPAWLAAMDALTWTQIGSNTPADVDPALDAAVNPDYDGTTTAPWNNVGTFLASFGQWNGGAYDTTNRRLAVGGGGHAGWLGNCYFYQDLDVDNPTWVRWNDPSGSIPFPEADLTANGANNALLPGGRPHAVHNYNGLAFNADGDLLQGPGGFQWEGNAAANGYYIRRNTDDWDTATAFALAESARPSMCYDEIRGVFWSYQGDQLYSYATDGTRTAYANTNGNTNGAGSKLLFDRVADRLVVFLPALGNGGSYVGASALSIDPDNPNTAPVVLTMPDSTIRAIRGIVIDETRHRYLVWNGGSDLEILTPPGTDITSGAWTSSTLSCTNDPGTALTNGTFGRMQIDVVWDCVILVTDEAQKTWALSLS